MPIKPALGVHACICKYIIYNLILYILYSYIVIYVYILYCSVVRYYYLPDQVTTFACSNDLGMMGITSFFWLM